MGALEAVMKKIGDLALHIAEIAAEHPQETAALLQIAQAALTKAPAQEK